MTREGDRSRMWALHGMVPGDADAVRVRGVERAASGKHSGRCLGVLRGCSVDCGGLIAQLSVLVVRVVDQ